MIHIYIYISDIYIVRFLYRQMEHIELRKDWTLFDRLKIENKQKRCQTVYYYSFVYQSRIEKKLIFNRIYFLFCISICKFSIYNLFNKSVYQFETWKALFFCKKSPDFQLVSMLLRNLILKITNSRLIRKIL